MTKSRSKQNKNAPPKQSKRQIKEIYKKKRLKDTMTMILDL
jgi:hypothetical protein